MGIKANLERLIKERETNVSKLASAAGVPKSSIYSILKRDSSKTSWETVQKLAKALDVDPIELFGTSQETAVSVVDDVLTRAGISFEEPVKTFSGEIEAVAGYLVKKGYSFHQIGLTSDNFRIEKGAFSATVGREDLKGLDGLAESVIEERLRQISEKER